MIETSDMQFDSRMVTAEETPEDHDVEVTLRPQTLAEYIGQDKVKENMAIYIQAAKRRGDPLDHVLLAQQRSQKRTWLSRLRYAEPRQRKDNRSQRRCQNENHIKN